MIKINKKDLKFVILFILIITLSFSYLYQSSYAKYRKKVKGQVDLTIASWKIKINNEDINSNKQLQNKIVPEFEESEYTKANVIAPGSKGYCDIVIDSKNVDVNFNTNITATVPSDSAIPDLTITDYIINPSAENQTKTPYNTADEINIAITHNTEQTTIRLFIEWNDDPTTETMTNIDDTNIAIDPNSEALIEINTKFTQSNT